MTGVADSVGVGVIGAGTMGAGIAQLALEAGHHVHIHNIDSAEAWVDGRLDRLTDAPAIADVAAGRPGLVIEAALEDLDLKRTIFRELDALLPGRAILATNTSALSVADIAAATVARTRVLGLHFFNPAPVMPLVEVIATPTTDPAVVDRATALMTAWGKVAVRSADTPGFIVNRVNRPFTLEALAMLEAGTASIETIDAAIRADGFPLGPFELMDLTGVDISLAAALGIFERSRAAGDPLAERFRPSPIQERLLAEGRLGRKTSGGFYDYDEAGRRIGPAPEFGAAPDAGGDARIRDRIVLAIVNEAYRAAGDDVATQDDIDLALRLGASHPSGPFERAAQLGGPAAVLAALVALAAAGPRFDPAPSLLATAG